MEEEGNLYDLPQDQITLPLYSAAWASAFQQLKTFTLEWDLQGDKHQEISF